MAPATMLIRWVIIKLREARNRQTYALFDTNAMRELNRRHMMEFLESVEGEFFMKELEQRWQRRRELR